MRCQTSLLAKRGLDPEGKVYTPTYLIRGGLESDRTRRGKDSVLGALGLLDGEGFDELGADRSQRCLWVLSQGSGHA